MPLRQGTPRVRLTGLMLTAIKVRQERVITSKQNLSTRRPAPYAWAGPTFRERPDSGTTVSDTEHEE